MFKLIISILTTLLLTFNIGVNAFGISDYNSKELNWYYVKNKDLPPSPAPEGANFLEKYDAYYMGNTDEKVLYLTFDEGYENGNTASILDTLKKHQVPAAFFVVKPYITQNPDLIKRMVEEGHFVCNHSNTHPSMASITDKDKFNKEFTSVEESFKELTGSDMPKFFRPPMGKYSELSLKMTKDLGYSSIFWSFAYKDWLINDQPSKDFAMKKIKSNIYNGSVILLHAVSDTNRDILDTLLTDLKNEGYTFKNLDYLIKK
ncbi:delta-lactam-biosynthetic de-N-acetylase [Clostridium fallax]|uniref:Peptidoglycan-N-acetylmuramic acid deacetylase n=1 Tax=Clostridium fallax TaxID=1533 RepID=A0A1M4YJQ6_9CLOT|nr:delta-lactam-biosynthetic de-N-acetylase [Clostridium fallax]SHF05971.1 peptidoglycan-N-acetylmuramic acid deacetylase [Clostridium fallax]SQB06294.1 polysaccharide deacetylase [Clostridium fallax]